GRSAAIRRAPSGPRSRSTRPIDQEVPCFACSELRPPSSPVGLRTLPAMGALERTDTFRVSLIERAQGCRTSPQFLRSCSSPPAHEKILQAPSLTGLRPSLE